MNLRLVFRNQTSRDDAVYVITATTSNGVHTVAGEWGKWDTFRTGGKLQRKVYYSGTSEGAARRQVREMQSKRRQRNYDYQPYLSWDNPYQDAPPTPTGAPAPDTTVRNPTSATPTTAATASHPAAPAPPKPGDPPSSYAGIETRAGALEF